jgi:hypothetical protein
MDAIEFVCEKEREKEDVKIKPREGFLKGDYTIMTTNRAK